MSIPTNQPHFRDDIQPLLQNHEQAEWLDLVTKKDETEQAKGDILASFFESIVNSEVCVTNAQLVTKTIDTLLNRESGKELSQKANNTFRSVLGFYQTASSAIVEPTKEKIASPQIPITILDMSADMLMSIGQYLEPKDLIAFVSANKQLLKQRAKILGANENFFAFFISKCAGKLETLEKNLFEDIKSCGGTIKSLTFSPDSNSRYLTVQDLSIIVGLFPNLESLQLLTTYRNRGFTDDELMPLSNLKKLKNLDLSGHDFLTGSGLKNLPKSLEKLSLTRCTSVNDDQGLEHFFKQSQNLLELNLVGCHKLPGSSLHWLPTTLQKLHLGLCSEISDENLKKTLEKCQKLVELGLGGCSQFTVLSLEKIPVTVQRLYIDQCEGINEETLQKILEKCQDLVEVSLDRLYYCNGSCLQALSPGVQKLYLKKWERLNEEKLKQVFINCKKLTDLDLTDCCQLDGSSLLELTPNIKNLYLKGCYELNEQTLKLAFEKWPQLQRLDISSCGQLTGFCLEALSPTIQRVDLSRDWLVDPNRTDELRGSGCRIIP